MASTSNHLSLAVARGKTQFPQRPISVEKFLIGSGEVCDLRLGGDSVPPLHCVIHSDGSDTWIDAVVNTPGLLINGAAVSSARINAGDQLQIGDFEFVVCEADSAFATTQKQPENTPVDVDVTDEELGQLISDMTAEQLVNQLEKDLALLDEQDAAEQTGANALLHAIVERQLKFENSPANPATLAKSAGDGEQLIHQIDRAIRALNQFSDDLKHRSEQMAERENSYAEAAVTMLEMQQQMAGQLESLVDQIATLKSKQAPVIRRVA